MNAYPAENISIAGLSSPELQGVSLNMELFSELKVLIKRSGAM